MKNESKNNIISSLMWKFSERMLAQGVSLIVSLCLARLLSPDDYGIVAMAMIVINIADVFVTSGFGNALVQKKDADNTDFSTIYFFNIVFSMLIYGVVFFTAPLVTDFFGNAEITLMLRVLGIRVPIAAINSIQQAYVSRHMMFKRFFWSTFFGTIISGIVGIVMALVGCGVWSLVAQYLTNTIIDTVVLWFTVKWRPELKFSLGRLKGLFGYGWKLVLSGVINTVFHQLNNLVIGKVYTKEQLAYYTNGDMYPQALTSGINTTISSVLFPALSQNQDDRARVKKMTQISIRTSSYIMWPVMLGFATVSPVFVDLILTQKWEPCVEFIQLFCISYAMYPIHTANLEAIKAMGRSDLYLKVEIIKKILSISVLLVVMWCSPLAIAVGGVFTSVCAVFINAFPNAKLIGYSVKEQLKDVFPSLIKALVMCCLIYPLYLANLASLITLTLQIILGIVIYMFLSVVTKDKNMEYLLQYIKK